jgi:L-fuconolactonase
MRIDAHQHFWDIQRFQYPWMPAGESPLRRSFLPHQLAPILERNNFQGSIVVQANTIIEETHWLLELAAQHEFIRGIVGWVDLTDAHVGATLDELQRHAKFKGARHLVHDEPDVNWLLRADVLRGLSELGRRDLPYDLLLRPQHLKLVARIAERVPKLRMVIDHIAKPPIAAQRLDRWAEDIADAAQVPQVYCKLSGMITEADPRGWKAEHLRPYVAHVLEHFGPDRLMFGSDWPVCTLAGTWKEVLAAFTQAAGPQTIEARDRLLGATAARFYRLD